MIIFALLFYFLVAYFCSILVEQSMSGVVPGGMKTSTFVGTIGAWFGGTSFGNFGPHYFAASLVAAVLGAAISIVILALLSVRFKMSH